MSTSARKPPSAPEPRLDEGRKPSRRRAWEAPDLLRLPLSQAQASPGTAGDGEVSFS